MATIYLVMRGNHNVNILNMPLKAFPTKALAQQYVQEYQAHVAAHPYDDSEYEEDDEGGGDYDVLAGFLPSKREAYETAVHLWERSGPTPNLRYAHSVRVEEIELEHAEVVTLGIEEL
jgi:hypothetical protein